MAARILDGKALSDVIKEEVREETSALVSKGIKPHLTAILVGEDPASKVYVSSKGKACEQAGIGSETIKEPAEITTEHLIGIVKRLNEDDSVDGILVQLPLPSHIDSEKVLNTISPWKDVDGFHPVNVGRLCIDGSGFVPCTPAGVLELLKREKIEIKGAEAVIVGRSNIVGKPMGLLLLHNHATVTWCHSRTKNLPEVARRADILIAAIGKPGFVTKEFIKPGATVIDVGINRVDNRDDIIKFFGNDEKRLEAYEKRGYTLVGDVHPLDGMECSGAYTPVPGGVGPLTIALLLKNTVRSASMRNLRNSG